MAGTAEGAAKLGGCPNSWAVDGGRGLAWRDGGQASQVQVDGWASAVGWSLLGLRCAGRCGSGCRSGAAVQQVRARYWAGTVGHWGWCWRWGSSELRLSPPPPPLSPPARQYGAGTGVPSPNGRELPTVPIIDPPGPPASCACLVPPVPTPSTTTSSIPDSYPLCSSSLLSPTPSSLLPFCLVQTPPFPSSFSPLYLSLLNILLPSFVRRFHRLAGLLVGWLIVAAPSLGKISSPFRSIASHRPRQSNQGQEKKKKRKASTEDPEYRIKTLKKKTLSTLCST